jgi:hypothetical protein
MKNAIITETKAAGEGFDGDSISGIEMLTFRRSL